MRLIEVDFVVEDSHLVNLGRHKVVPLLQHRPLPAIHLENAAAVRKLLDCFIYRCSHTEALPSQLHEVVLSMCRESDFGREFDEGAFVEFEASLALFSVFFAVQVEEMVDFREPLPLHVLQLSVEARPLPSASRVCAVESQVEEQAVIRLHDHKVFVGVAIRLLDDALVGPIA